jgi:hypothetical protein
VLTNSTIVIKPFFSLPINQGWTFQLPQYVFKKRLEISAQDTADILNQDGGRFKCSCRSEHLGKKVTFICLSSVLPAQAKGLARGTCSEQPHALREHLPIDFLDVLFEHGHRERSALDRVVT